jgi:hypothetical protein
VTATQTITGAIVAFEVYNAAGSRVYKSYSGPLTLSTNNSWVTSTWKLPTGQSTGTYTVKVLVYGANWTPLYATIALQKTKERGDRYNGTPYAEAHISIQQASGGIPWT